MLGWLGYNVGYNYIHGEIWMFEIEIALDQANRKGIG